MNQVKATHCASNFVWLQVAHQMPTCSTASEFIDFQFGLLDAIFPKVGYPCRDRHSQGLSRMSLANSDQPNVFEGPPRPVGGFCHPASNDSKSLCQTFLSMSRFNHLSAISLQ